MKKLWKKFFCKAYREIESEKMQAQKAFLLQKRKSERKLRTRTNTTIRRRDTKARIAY